METGSVKQEARKLESEKARKQESEKAEERKKRIPLSGLPRG